MSQLTPISVMSERRGYEIELPLLSHADDAAANEEMKMESESSLCHLAAAEPAVVAARIIDGIEPFDSTDSLVSETLVVNTIA